jgi:hypothetical protein
MITKRSKNFVPSGLDEVFESMMKHKQEAIAKGWIKNGVVQTQTVLDYLITEGKPKPKDEPKPKPETESAGGKK